jgi:hypothetical protein
MMKAQNQKTIRQIEIERLKIEKPPPSDNRYNVNYLKSI